MPYSAAAVALSALLLAGCAAAQAVPVPALAGATPPAALLRGFPPLPAYDSLGLGRAASATSPPGVELAGTAYYAIGGDHQENGQSEAVLGGLTTASYLIYALPATGLADETLTLTVGASGPDGYWVGQSDYAAGRWRWTGPVTDSPPTLACPADYTRADGATFVAVVAFGGNSAAVASLVRTGSGMEQTPPPDGQALTVGPGRTYATIEDAYAAAPSTGGATILVYPAAGGYYSQPHLEVYKPDITFWGVGAPAGERVQLNGDGYNYTGAGSVPRAVFQFNPGADGCTVRGFNIYNAHNDSYNGAAVRINQANHVRVLDCDIEGCDMGLMSNGDASAVPPTGADQWVGYCVIAGNGNASDPGYNHNLYMGGTSFTLHACDVFGSLTGHNVKSRAHFNRIEYCYIHDSSNREFDLVDDATNTALPGSDSVLVGNVIDKDPACPGNRGVVHFGQDGGNDHNGTLYLINNTIVTPFISPVVALDAANAKAQFVNNIVWDQASGQNNQVVADASGGASLSNVTGHNNWLSHGFGLPAGFDAGTTWQGASGEDPPFLGGTLGEFELTGAYPHITDAGAPWSGLSLPPTPGRTPLPGEDAPYQYKADADLELRIIDGQIDLGAYEYSQLGT
jgi:hypothetical protein